MNFIGRAAKIFAVSFLIFLGSNAASGQPDSIYRLPAGTRIRLSMDSEISSKVSSVDDTFTATVSQPLLVGKAIVLSSGTIVEGRVVKVSTAGIGRKNGRMELKFETIRFANDLKRDIDARLVNDLKADTAGTIDLLTILGGTAAGAVIGAATKMERGALIGAGIGTGVGAGAAVLRKGKDVFIKTDEEFEIELKTGVVLPARGY